MRYIRRFRNKFFYEITPRQRIGVIMIALLFIGMTIPMWLFMGFWWTVLGWIGSIVGTIYVVMAVNFLTK